MGQRHRRWIRRSEVTVVARGRTREGWGSAIRWRSIRLRRFVLRPGPHNDKHQAQFPEMFNKYNRTLLAADESPRLSRRLETLKAQRAQFDREVKYFAIGVIDLV